MFAATLYFLDEIMSTSVNSSFRSLQSGYVHALMEETHFLSSFLLKPKLETRRVEHQLGRLLFSKTAISHKANLS